MPIANHIPMKLADRADRVAGTVGLVQQAFFESLGIADVRLADYLTGLLCRFVRMDAIFGGYLGAAGWRGRRLEEVAEMLAELPACQGGGRVDRRQRERAIHKHIGDFVLFWTGVHPEFLRYLRSPGRKDQLVDYMTQGRRSYYIASTFRAEPFRAEARTLRRLSDALELCAYGLSLVRQGWESLAPESYNGFRRRWCGEGPKGAPRAE